MSTEEKDLEATAAPAAEETAAPEKQEEKPARRPARRSRKQVAPEVWEELKADMEDGTILSVKINSAVKGGVISFVNGVRGFIPASLLSIAYVENLEDWAGKTIDVKVITVEPEDGRLVLSGKAVEEERRKAARAEKYDAVNIGDVFDGTVERIVTFGAFVGFDECLSGLVHISQMANHRVESPDKVVAVGDTVKVKVIGKKDGKISLSMRQALEDGEVQPRRYREKDPAFDYHEDRRATTNLGDLLKDIKLD